MSIKYKTNKRKLSSLVKQQVPSYVLEDHPKFTEFLSSYYLFMESAELNLDTFTAIDQILLETEGTVNSFVLLDQTNKNGLDAGGTIVDEQNTFGGSFQKGEVVTGSTSGATSTVLAEDTLNNSRLFVSANNAWITGEIVTGSVSGATAEVAKYRANPVENLQQLLNYSDPDHTISDFLTQMKEEFLNTIPTDTHASVDTRKLVKNIKSLYRAKGTEKAHKAFFKLLFNEASEVYRPTDDMLRVSGGNWSTQNFIRCTQTLDEQLNDTIELVGQKITQANNPSDGDINLATAIVETVTKFREGTVEIIEVAINAETTVGTFVVGQSITGQSFVNDEITVSMTTSQAISDTTITNDGSTLTVGDEATLTGGAGAGARIQVLDIQGAGVTEVIVNAAGTGYEEGDVLTFNSGTAEAKVAVVNGGFIPESGSVDIHVELESGTVTGGGSGDLLFEDATTGASEKFLDSTSLMYDTEIRTELENEVGHILSETSESHADSTQISDKFYIVHQGSEPERPIGLEADDRIGLESQTVSADSYSTTAIVQENASGVGDITDIRMIASGSGYTTLPTATISGVRFIKLEDATDSDSSTSRILFEDGGRVLSNIAFDGADATVIPFGDEIGKATSLNIIEHGINYTSAPTIDFPHYAVLTTASGAITLDETFTSSVSGATGTVIDYSYPLLKYTATTSSLVVGDTVTFSGAETAVVVKSDPLTGSGQIAVNITTAGKYVNQDGHISEGSKKIQDSLYYQDYSYVIKVSESINKWRDALKRAVHPSGFYVTGQVNIATSLSGQIKQPVGATFTGGLFSGTSDSPIYMRLNTLFNRIFGRRTGVGFHSMSNGIELDGKTKRTRSAANAGYAVAVNDAFTSAHYTAGQKDVNLSPETTIELEQRNRNSFYDLNSYTVRNVEVRNGYAYGGPRVKNLSDRAFTTFAANNAITLEGGSGDGEILLENETGVLQHPQSDSWSTTIADWNTLRFSGTLNSNVDGETMRLSDINGTNSSQNHKINFAFPTEVTKSA